MSGIVIADFQLMTEGAECWPLAVVVMDMLLLVRARMWVADACLGAICAWLVLRSALDTVDTLGLYDSPCGLAGADFIIPRVVLRIAPFVVDYYLTQGRG